MNRADIGKTTTWAHDGKWSTWPALEEEKARILFRWVFLFVALGVEVAEHDLSFVYLVDHEIDRVHRNLGFHVAMIGQEIRHASKPHLVVCTAVQRQYETTKPFEGWMVYDIVNSTIGIHIPFVLRGNTHSRLFRTTGQSYFYRPVAISCRGRKGGGE